MASLTLLPGDITKIKADAIVNAANTSLLGGGGVDGAIHRAGGKAILDACREIRNRQGKCKVGEAVITTAGLLPAQYVIHTVGPVWNKGGDAVEALLASAYRSSFELALEHGVKTIAFPNISTGIYRFPKQRAAEIALDVAREYASASNGLEEIIFVCFDAENFGIYQKLIAL
ncbi:UNVERIFIED_CONTAM: hypothetical protein GTU68_061117 [Idotea baltica]|nr:hypothetical protein [Idotea baltica]